jgi:arylformamidase
MTPVNMEALSALSAIFARSKTVDLTALLENGIPRWPSHPHLVIDPTVTHSHDGYYCQSISLPEHCGTHMDAPYHVHPDMPEKTVEHIRPDALIGSCTVIDLSDRDWQPGERATLDDIMEYLNTNEAKIEQDDIVLINYGWYKKYWTTTSEWKYYVLNQPGLSDEAAQYMIDNRVRAVGTDTTAVGTPVVDGKSGTCYFHERVLRSEIYLMESLINLELLPVKCFFIATPLKIHKGSGSPIRAVAIIPE